MRFPDCRDQKTLPFDFYLPGYNLIIEYDGRQHTDPNAGWGDLKGGKYGYNYIHRHDLMKNQYCKDNNINLLRIPYTITGDAIGETTEYELSRLNKTA